MLLHHVYVLFPDGSTWDTFVEATDREIEKIAERLAFYKDHGDVSDWRTSRVIREHDFDSLKRGLDKRVEEPPKKKGKDADWPYDWPRPDA
jgi:hypothetical protein